MIIQKEKRYGFLIKVLDKNNVWRVVYKSEYMKNCDSKLRYFRMLRPNRIYKLFAGVI